MLLEGRSGLVVGIANERSIAWGCARTFRALGAESAVEPYWWIGNGW